MAFPLLEKLDDLIFRLLKDPVNPLLVLFRTQGVCLGICRNKVQGKGRNILRQSASIEPDSHFGTPDPITKDFPQM